MMIGERDLSFGDVVYGLGTDYPAMSKGVSSIGFSTSILDEEMKPITSDRKLKWRWEIWPYNKKTGETTPLWGEEVIDPNFIKPDGRTMFFAIPKGDQVGILGPDTVTPVAGSITIWYLPKGAEDKPGNYVEVVSKRPVYYWAGGVTGEMVDMPSFPIVLKPAGAALANLLPIVLVGGAALALGIFVLPAILKK